MRSHLLPYEEVPQFSDRDKAYVAEDPRLRPFYKYPVSLQAFGQVIGEKETPPAIRASLVEVLKDQYRPLNTSAEVEKNIELLADRNTYTITTAHQPSLFTGPLYYVYKIISCLKICEKLREQYPDHHFVPVFVSGSEDHDFEEINHAHLFGKTIRWEQSQGGPVGWLPTDGLAKPLRELKDILGDSDRAEEIYRRIETAYTQHDRYAEAAQHLVNDLFGKFGLVILNMNEDRLKRHFIPAMREELLDQVSVGYVEKATRELEEAGFSGQAHARAINLFYLGDGFRNRIVREGDHWQVLETDIRWTREALLAELEARPGRFSPNVVMRPIYQELILPNLAYVGGGGEIAYWLERKEQFAHFGLNFPMLVRRDSVLWIDKGSAKKMDKNGLSVRDILRDTEELIKAYVRVNTENEVSLKEEKKAIGKIFDATLEKARQIDPTLVKSAKAEIQKTINSLNVLEGKLIRAEKNNHDIAIKQIRAVKERLFPANGLQERYDNFLTFYLRHGEDFFRILLENLDPLRKKLTVIEEE